VRAPAEAGQDKARLTLSLPDWKGGCVTPATFDVPLPAAKPAVKASKSSGAILKKLEKQLAAGDDRQRGRAVEIENLKILLQQLSSEPGGKDIEREVAQLQVNLAALNAEWTKWQKERAKIQKEMERLRKKLQGTVGDKAGPVEKANVQKGVP
jgi:chromosome segregation ATPase